jgi:hypothetical protein
MWSSRIEKSQMSDNYQTLAFDSIDESEAVSAAERAIQWMIANGYVCAERTDCVYGSEDGLGHRPGPRWRELVDESEEQRLWDLWSRRTGQPAPIAAEMVDQFLPLAINGLEATTGRHVCHPL